MSAFWLLARVDIQREVRRRWFLGVVVAGIVASVMVVIGATTASNIDDTFRSGGASVLLLGGLVVALGLGATAFWRDIQSGSLGLAAAAGAPRGVLSSSRVVSRLAMLAGVLAVWTFTLVVGGLVSGLGLHGPFITHALAEYVTLALTLLATAAASTVLGPWVAAIIGLMMHITAQATVNLSAAADVGRLGSANRLAHVAYNMLPHTIVSPMIAEMQNRDAGGPAAPQFEINNVPVPIHPSTMGSVLWTIAWCAFLAWLCFVGIRRRNLN